MIENRRGFDIFCHAVLILGVALIVFPVYVAFCAATMNSKEVFSVLLSLVPSSHLFENVAHIWTQGSGNAAAPFGLMLLNSLMMALAISIGKISVSIISAYAIVFFRFPLKNLAFWLIFITLMLPVEVRIFPTVEVVSSMHLSNTYAGLTLPLIASATATFLFRQFFMTLPDELMEAARIDGAGPLRFFWDVVLPLSKTNIAALRISRRSSSLRSSTAGTSISGRFSSRISSRCKRRWSAQEHDRIGRYGDRMALRDGGHAACDARFNLETAPWKKRGGK